LEALGAGGWVERWRYCSYEPVIFVWCLL